MGPETNLFTLEDVAEVCHEANRALCIILGDDSQKPWEELSDAEKSSTIRAVQWRLEHRDAGPTAQHDQWVHDKLANGWQHGEKKDPEKKTHPCIVPFDLLPIKQQVKDKLFAAIALAMV